MFSEILVLLSFSTKSAELQIKEFWEYNKGLNAVQSHFPILAAGALVHATIGLKGIPCLCIFGKP